MKRTPIILGLLLTLALGLRLFGIGWGQPYRLHPDASKYVHPAARCSIGDFNPDYFHNPSGFTYPLWLYSTALNELAQATGILQPTRNLYDRYQAQPWLTLLWGRCLVTVLGVFSVWLIFRLALRLMNERGALFAALVLAVCFLHVRQSRYAVNDVPMLALFLGSTWLTVRVWETGRWRDLLWAALVAGYTTGTKYTGVVTVLAIAPAVLWASPEALAAHESPRSSVAFQPWRAALLVAVVSALGFLIACPYAVLEPSIFWEQVAQFGKENVRRWEGQGGAPVTLLAVQALVFGVGLGPLGICCAGLWRERNNLRTIPWRRLAPLGAGPLSFLLIAMQPLFFARFALTLVPFVALLSGWAADRLIPSGSRRLLWIVLLVLLLGGESTVRSVRHGWLCRQPDTRALAVAALAQTLQPGQAVAADHMALPFRFWEAARDPVSFPYVDLGMDLTPLDTAQLAAQGFAYLVVSNHAQRLLLERHGPESLGAWQERLAETAEPVLHIPAGKDIPHNNEHVHTPLVGLFRTERPGPDLLVYRLRMAEPKTTSPKDTARPGGR